MILNSLQISVTAMDARPHAQVVGRRNQFEQWIYKRDQRQQYDLEPIDEIGGPERQIALQEWRARVEEPLGRIADGKIQNLTRGEFTRLFEQSSLAVDLSCDAEQQLGKRRVKLLAHSKRGRRRK